MFDSFCAYRLPDKSDVAVLKGNVIEGIHPGFVIAPFDLSADAPITISNLIDAEFYEFETIKSKDTGVHQKFPMPSKSTSETEHHTAVEKVIKELDGNPGKKTIIARVMCCDGKIDAAKTFESLAKALPTAFVFLFHTPLSGSWIGASPELLIKCDGETITTHALAGTRLCNGTNDWNKKNIEEQRIVRDYILNYFHKNNLQPVYSETETRRAGSIEHLFTRITARIPQFPACPSDNFFNNPGSIISFLKGYSPTPALCGMPKEESLERISRIEEFQRGYYGGFCGPCCSSTEFTYFVNLRSLRFDNKNFCFFAGGGITSQSNPAEEWHETENKARSILSLVMKKP